MQDEVYREILEDLVLQLLTQRPHLIRYALPLVTDESFESRKPWMFGDSKAFERMKEDILLECLVTALKDPSVESVYCVLDGFDEVPLTARGLVVGLMKQLAANPNSNILITGCRGSTFNRFVSVHLWPSAEVLDISHQDFLKIEFETFVRQQTRKVELPGVPSRLRGRIADALVASAENEGLSYAHASLVLRLFSKMRHPWEIELHLEGIEKNESPASIDTWDVYQNLIARGTHEALKDRALCHLACAARPVRMDVLLLFELLGLGHGIDARLWESWSLLKLRHEMHIIESRLRDELRDFVRDDAGYISIPSPHLKRHILQVLKDPTNRWRQDTRFGEFHKSRASSSFYDNSDNLVKYATEADIHAHMASACIAYLHFWAQHQSEQAGDDVWMELDDALRYSNTFWLDHLYRASLNGSNELIHLIKKLLEVQYHHPGSLPAPRDERDRVTDLKELGLPGEIPAALLSYRHLLNGGEQYALFNHSFRALQALSLSERQQVPFFEFQLKQFIRLVTEHAVSSQVKPKQFSGQVKNLPEGLRGVLALTFIDTAVVSGEFNLDESNLEGLFGQESSLAGLLQHTISSQSGPSFDIVMELARSGSFHPLQRQDLDPAMLLAARKAVPDVCERLLRRGADPSCHNERNATPLHLAASAGNVAVMEVLVEWGASPFALDVERKAPIHYAAACGNRQAIQSLLRVSAQLDGIDANLRSPLFIACAASRFDAAELLIDQLADFRRPDVTGKTPLHAAVAKGAVQIVRLLLSRGSNANTISNDGLSPLHTAASMGWNLIVDDLLKAGADIDLCSSDTTANDKTESSEAKSSETMTGENALMFACKARGTNEETIRILLAAGADVNKLSQDKHKRTALHLAAEFGRPEFLIMLVETNASINSTDAEGRTPLHVAARSDLFEANMSTLIQYGANAGAEDANHKTVRDYATTECKKDEKIVNRILKAKH